jgi:hypothetical protein
MVSHAWSVASWEILVVARKTVAVAVVEDRNVTDSLSRLGIHCR